MSACSATFRFKTASAALLISLERNAVLNRKRYSSGDSGLKPAVKAVKECNPNLIITALIPSSRFFASNDLKSVCDSAPRFGIKHLEKSLFPEIITTTDGQTIIRTEKYKP